MTDATGTLTFLFTDLEGSTRLWEEQPVAMRTALARHDEILRDVVARADGQLIKSTGDGAFATFRSPVDGVRAAVDSQQAFIATEWPDGIDLQVRMGVHLGLATERDGDWFGPDVNRAARVMAVAHGGQVVCSSVVGEFVRDEFDLADLGVHRLRDLGTELHLFQVGVPGGPTAFPPLRSLDAYRSNLPYELSAFVGRHDTIRQVADLVASHRVVSIVGVGGVGKTRLALQVGSEVMPHSEDGVWFCELATVRESDDMLNAVAAAVGYVPPAGVTVADGLPRFLERKRLLLILDNCEHLVRTVAGFVAATTTHAEHVSVLVTSREALGLPGEQVVPLASLALPEASHPIEVLSSEAGELFVTRAREAGGELIVDDVSARSVCELCIRLDGIPLAIELAAGQTRVMTPDEINRRLDRQFRLLTGGRHGVLERHQTLRAAIDWSYDLLAPAERFLLDRLSVFVGGFDLDALEALARESGVDEFEAFESLASLVAKSLVERNDRGGRTRYRLLEMIRQYAAESLAAGEATPVTRDAHARHYLALTARCFQDLVTERDYEAMELLDLETPNIGAAARWYSATDRLADLMAFYESLVFIDPFAIPKPLLEDLSDAVRDALERPEVVGMPGFLNACFLVGALEYGNGLGPAYQHVTELMARAGDPRLSFRASVNESTLAFIANGDFERASERGREGVEAVRAAGSPPGALAWGLSHYAVMSSVLQPDAAIPVAEEALAVARSSGSSVARLYPLLAIMTATSRSDPRRAMAAGDELLSIDRTRNRFWSELGRGTAVLVRVESGDLMDGLKLCRESLEHFAEQGERHSFALFAAQLAGTVVVFDDALAVDIAAVTESDVIAPVATFDAQPGLVERADELTPLIPAARARAAVMTYDEAIALVFAAIDQIIEQLDRGTD